jgi:hypothetical protein
VIALTTNHELKSACSALARFAALCAKTGQTRPDPRTVHARTA